MNRNTQKSKTQNKKGGFKIGSREKEIFSIIFKCTSASTIGISLAVLFAILPGLPVALNLIIKHLNANSNARNTRVFPSNLRRTFEKMKKERLLYIKEKNGETEIILQEKGVKYIIVNNLDNLKFKKPKHWDKIWRIIIFDVPEKYKRIRDTINLKMKELKFYPLQKSVFVYPYPPYEIINFLTEIFGVSSYYRIIDAIKIEGEEEILAHFEITR